MIAGKRIVITRAADKAGEFAAKLKALGAEPILLPMIEIAPLEDTSQLDAALKKIPSPYRRGEKVPLPSAAMGEGFRVRDYDWLIFTSANTVEYVWQRLEALHLPPQFPKIAAVGQATAQALQTRGITPDLVPAVHTAEGLFEAMISLKQQLQGTRILLPQSEIARPTLAELLRGAGAEVETVIAYRTIRPENVALDRPFDVITFTSSSTVQHFCEMFENPLALIGQARVACIGPITAETARDFGLPVHLIANPHTLEGLINSLIQPPTAEGVTNYGRKDFSS